jgi:hypothetical protein
MNMKKIICIFSILLLAQVSFAADSGTITLGSTITSDPIPLSANVYAEYNGTATAYGIGTVNKLGTKSFGTSNASSMIYFDEVDVGTDDPTDVTAGNSTWASATWTELGK